MHKKKRQSNPTEEDAVFAPNFSAYVAKSRFAGIFVEKKTMDPLYIALLVILAASAGLTVLHLLVWGIRAHPRKRREAFVWGHSLALRHLEKAKARCRFRSVPDFTIIQSYDNEDFYGDISPEDVLIYELKTRQVEVKKALETIKKNERRYEKLLEEIKENLPSFREFDVPMSEKERQRLSSIAKDVYQRAFPKRPAPFRVRVTMKFTDYGGSFLDSKTQTFSAEETETLLRRLGKKRGSYYCDDAIFRSLCRVERGRVSNRVRFAVYERDGYRCCKCGSVLNLEIGHIIPISKGGTSDLNNLQTLCHDCNVKKGNRIE